MGLWSASCSLGRHSWEHLLRRKEPERAPPAPLSPSRAWCVGGTVARGATSPGPRIWGRLVWKPVWKCRPSSVLPPPPGIQGAGRDAWGQLQAASGKRVVGSRWPGGRPRRQKRTEGAVLCDERGLCSEGLGLFFMSRLCFFNFTLFLKQGTPLKRDGEECTSEGKGIAARILGPSKPVGAGRRREAAPDSCGQRASLHGLGRVLRREVQTARNRSTRVV